MTNRPRQTFRPVPASHFTDAPARRGRPSGLTPERRAVIEEMLKLERQHCRARVAARLGVSESTLVVWIRKVRNGEHPKRLK